MDASGHCSMGVGCDESGVCYATAHGQPEQCPRSTRNTLLALTSRIEALTGPDRKIDILIVIALGMVPTNYERAVVHGKAMPYFWIAPSDSHAPYWSPLDYTASLDAAMTLVLEGWGWMVVTDDGATVFQRNGRHGFAATHHSDATTPALALTAAALRARAASMEGQDGE